MHLEIWHYPLLFIASVAAGWVDSIAGGGGIITIPALLGVELPPKLALGTNKCQSSFGSLTAAINYTRNGLANFKKSIPGIIYTIAGACAGTIVVQHVDNEILNYVIPALLIAIAVYMLISPNLGTIEKKGVMPLHIVFLTSGLTIGFYDGFFGPGTGNFWAIALVVLAGFNLSKSTGYTKIMNFTSNITSLVIFIYGGHVLFVVGVMMGFGQVIGAKIGSGMVIKRGANFIRPIFILVAILITIYIVIRNFFLN